MKSSMKHEIIDKFGFFFQSYGVSEIMGRVLGLLITSSDPVSLNEITETLGLSKASISIQIRKLEEIGYCKKTPRTKDRRDYYVYNDQFIQWTLLNYIAVKEKNQKVFMGLVNEVLIIDNHSIDEIEYKEIQSRLSNIKEFNEMFIRILKNSYHEWEEFMNKGGKGHNG